MFDSSFYKPLNMQGPSTPQQPITFMEMNDERFSSLSREISDAALNGVPPEEQHKLSIKDYKNRVIGSAFSYKDQYDEVALKKIVDALVKGFQEWKASEKEKLKAQKTKEKEQKSIERQQKAAESAKKKAEKEASKSSTIPKTFAQPNWLSGKSSSAVPMSTDAKPATPPKKQRNTSKKVDSLTSGMANLNLTTLEPAHLRSIASLCHLAADGLEAKQKK